MKDVVYVLVYFFVKIDVSSEGLQAVVALYDLIDLLDMHSDSDLFRESVWIHVRKKLFVHLKECNIVIHRWPQSSLTILYLLHEVFELTDVVFIEWMVILNARILSLHALYKH